METGLWLLALTKVTGLKQCLSGSSTGELLTSSPTPSPYPDSLEGSHCVWPPLRKRKVKLPLLEGGLSAPFIGNPSVWEICLFSLIYWFIQSLFVTMCTHGYLVYISGYKPILFCLLCCLNDSSFGHWELLQLAVGWGFFVLFFFHFVFNW